MDTTHPNDTGRTMKVASLKQVTYDPAIFLNVETIEDAASVILTPEAGLTSAQRWKSEAPFIMNILQRHIKPRSLVLDYGCGIGRLARPLIAMLQCRVVGVDISPNMRALAASCVESDKFFAMPPQMLDVVNSYFDAVLAVWTLQHVFDLKQAIEQIKTAIRPKGILFVLNNHQRALPTDGGPWIDDGRSVDEEVQAAGFAVVERGQLSGPDIAGTELAAQTFWAVYRKP